LSTHPKPEVKEKVWTTPNITSTELSGTPYAHFRGIVRSALAQADRDVSLNPNDQAAVELQRSLQRMLEALESKAHRTAA
jgi:hypothetical protein